MRVSSARPWAQGYADVARHGSPRGRRRAALGPKVGQEELQLAAVAKGTAARDKG